MNTTKIYEDGSGYLITTNEGNFEVTNEHIKRTTRTGAGLTETSFDLNVQGIVDNAQNAAVDVLSVGEIQLFKIIVNEKIEDFD